MAEVEWRFELTWDPAGRGGTQRLPVGMPEDEPKATEAATHGPLRAASDGKPMPGVSDSLSSCIHWRIFGRQPKRTAAQAAVGLGGSGCRTVLQGCQHL